ncbi:MAG: hypothetical protein KC435_01045 [Thermomicrobiales bacterium]|nr:hypothetical protein [Thermomicrobiales bacterium]
MSDVQNERTESRNRRRPRRHKSRPHAQSVAETAVEPVIAEEIPLSTPEPPQPAVSPAKPWIRPGEIEAPTVPIDVYCVLHSASAVEREPVVSRNGMTTLRHLAVDHFGEATLFCDCLHNGPHEWPPSLQKLETAIELDQFLHASTSEA